MKLKYYLRGLGIGIILATLIITISGSRKQLSDNEIITKAMELGMVMKEDPKGNLDEVMVSPPVSDPKQGQDPTPSPAQTENSKDPDSAVPSEEPDGVVPTEGPDSVIPTEGPDSVVPAEEQDSVVPNEEPEDAVSTEEQGNTVPSEDGAAQTEEKITFTVEKGMSSGKVATMLQSIGLIDSAEEFNNFIIQKGKAGAIMIGEYTVTRGASFEVILKAITKQ